MSAKPNAILKGALVEEQDYPAQIHAAAQTMKPPCQNVCKDTDNNEYDEYIGE